MTVVNLVENIPSKKLYDIDKNIDVDVKENKLFNANQNNKNLTKLNNKSFSQNGHTNNRTFERKLVDDKKIKIVSLKKNNSSVIMRVKKIKDMKKRS